jgi:MOSC domain-containing protein
VHVAELWRYPVKSMGGERLESAELLKDGIRGDRVVHVRNGRERIVTARSRPLLLGHRATIGPDGEPLVDGRPWMSKEVARDVEAAAPASRLVRSDEPGRFDILPLLVATDGAIAAFGHDRRRLRPNLVIGGVKGLAERAWEGRRLRIGDVVIALADLRARCVMTTFDPDTQVQDVGVLLAIQRDFDGRLALNAAVERPGVIRVGDPVTLQD